jgi:hypothetical protein
MEQRSDRAFRLSWEFEHMEFVDRETELELCEFPGSGSLGRLVKITPLDLPDPVVFNAYFQALAHTDYPTNNVYWPVMSRRMYYVLNSIGNFAHRVIPIAMLNDTAYPDEQERCFLSDGKPNPAVTNFDDFVAVQLLEEKDYFDFEHSVYKPSPKFPEWVHAVQRYILREPPEGFPPLFRLSAHASSLFVSAQAREALKEAGIRGTAYELLDNPLQEEVDIPVQLPTYP